MTNTNEVLQGIYDRNGHLTAELVLKEAEGAENPLHRFFEWDDSEAAHRYRLFQAGALIRRCRITVEKAPDRTIRVRAFAHVPAMTAYASTADVLTGEHRDELLAQCRREIAALRRKYEGLLDFDAVLAEAREAAA